MHAKSALIAATALAAALSACATTDGFSVFDETSVSNEAALNASGGVFVAPVTFDLEPFVRSIGPNTGTRRQRSVSDRDLENLAENFRDDIVRALDNSGVQVLDEASSDGLVVEPVLTRVSSTRPSFAELSDNPALSAQSIYAGGGAVRVVFKRDGDEVAVFEDTEITTLGDGRPRVGIWSDLNREFDRWARGIALVLGG